MSAAEAGFATRFVWCGDRSSCEVDDCDDEEHGGPWLVGHHGDRGGVESEHETRAEARRTAAGAAEGDEMMTTQDTETTIALTPAGTVRGRACARWHGGSHALRRAARGAYECDGCGAFYAATEVAAGAARDGTDGVYSYAPEVRS